MKEQFSKEVLTNLLDLYYHITYGAMKIKIPWWKRLFKKDIAPEIEEYITTLQSKVETLVNTNRKKRLTFIKGIPYTIPEGNAFINSCIKELSDE
jgi:urate oxidase